MPGVADSPAPHILHTEHIEPSSSVDFTGSSPDAVTSVPRVAVALEEDSASSTPDADKMIDLEAIRDNPRVRCLDGFDEYKRTHAVKDGAFYIVHNGAVLDEPLPSRDVALQLLQAIEFEGGTVNWNAMLVIEAGNEWGQRHAMHAFSYITTSKYEAGCRGFSVAKV